MTRSLLMHATGRLLTLLTLVLACLGFYGMPIKNVFHVFSVFLVVHFRTVQPENFAQNMAINDEYYPHVCNENCSGCEWSDKEVRCLKFWQNFEDNYEICQAKYNQNKAAAPRSVLQRLTLPKTSTKFRMFQIYTINVERKSYLKVFF